jgi:Tfp pilus assembly protein PilF
VEKNPKSIYEIERGDPHRHDLANRPNTTMAEVWARETRRRSWRTLLYVVFFAVFGALLSVVAIQQYMLNTRIVTEPDSSLYEIDTARVSERKHPLDFDISPQAETLMRALGEVAENEVPEEGRAPLNTQWIKQAAYYVVLAERAYKAEDMETALQNYNKALDIFPDMKGVQRYRGLIYLHLQDYPAAAEAFEKSAQTESPDAQGVLNNLGVSLLALDDYTKAEEYFSRALTADPDYALPYLNLATLHRRRGENMKAADYFREYLSRKPDDIRAAQAYASILMEERQWQRAAALLANIRQKAPELAPVYFKLAVSLGHLGKNDEAAIVLRRGTTLVDPRKALAWLARDEFDILRNQADFRAIVNMLSGTEEAPSPQSE